jgi:hypothetical protein
MKSYEIIFVNSSNVLQTYSVKTDDIKSYVERLKKEGMTIYDYMQT